MHVRGRLVLQASLLLCLAPLLWTGCGEDPLVGLDSGVLPGRDAAQPGRDAEAEDPGPDAARPGLDAAAATPDSSTSVDSGGALDAGLLPDAALAPDSGSSSDTGAAGADASEAADTGSPVGLDAGATPDTGASCGRTAKPADRTRKILLAHPYSSTGAKANVWDVLELSSVGTITQPSPRVSFTMGRGTYGQVVFTPDGELAFAPQEDGSIGVVKFDLTGAPVVLNPGYKDGFYASKVVVDPSGDRLFVVDENWPNNGGGIYSVRIGCDGVLTKEGKLFSSKNAYAFVLPAWTPRPGLLGRARGAHGNRHRQQPPAQLGPDAVAGR